MKNTVLFLSIGLSLLAVPSFGQDIISLDGEWHFSCSKAKSDFSGGATIILPGTMDQAGFGYPAPECEIDNQWTFGWRRPVVFEGEIAVEREVTVPGSWKGRYIELFIEQTRSESTVYVDGNRVGPVQNSLVTSHYHDLSEALTPGRHTIRLVLDNSNKHGIGGSYIRSAMGQGNWQGVVGRFELRCKPVAHITNVVFTPHKDNTATVDVMTSSPVSRINVSILNSSGVAVVKNSSSKSPVVVDISTLEKWDEFNPVCYRLRTEVIADKEHDIREENIGIRFVDMNERNQFCVNGRPIFLRGTVSYNIFPLTGYPATDIDEWEKIFRIYQKWGMNHVRFHSLTPPAAALDAADKLGIYLQCEAPKAGRAGKVEDDEFHIAEGRRILSEYGNHPSFILMSMGNELSGSVKDIQNIYDRVTADDRRRLYTTTTGSSKQELKDDYKIYGGIVRGFKGPFTDWDYRETAKRIGQTMLSHEVGQWNTFPDVGIIGKYSGVMKPDNLILVRNELEKKGLLPRAEEFTQTTGKFAALLFKDEMEAIQRTPDYGGFQILMLNDFPAQGTATSGMIDIFNDEKGYITPEVFSEYCAPVVPLVRLKKRTFINREKITASVDMSCYTPKDMEDVSLLWEVRNGDKIIDRGRLTPGTIKTGNVYPVGSFSADISSVKVASRLEIVVSVEGTGYRNRWNVWVYPTDEDVAIPDDIDVTHTWQSTREALARGRKVLFFPSSDELAMWRPGQFKTIFWSPIWLKRGIETMSICADVNHPALGGFPTERHTDWQWFSVLENSLSFSIDNLPLEFTPVVGLIDSYRKNQRMANIIETRVGKGSLLMTTLNLMSKMNGDLARLNIKKSLVDYMSSPAFNPVQSLSEKQLESMFSRKVAVMDGTIPAEKDCRIRLSADGSNKLMQSGYDCKIGSKIQKSGELSAWADKRDIDINITLPASSEGTLYLFLRNSRSSRWGMLKTPQEIVGVDWVEETFENYGNKYPACCVIVNGEYIQTLDDFGSTGHWYAVPVEKCQTAGGKLRVRLSTFNFPNILTELAFCGK